METEDQKRQRVQEAILQRLAAAQDDNSGIAQAAADDKRKKIIMAIGQGLSGLATADSASRGGYKSDSGFYDKLASGVDSRSDAEKSKRDKVQSIIQEQALRSKFGDEEFDRTKLAAGNQQASDKLGEDKRQFNENLKFQKDKLAALAKLAADKKSSKPTVGEDTTDREFAKNYEEYQSSGGAKKAEAAIANLETIANDVEKMNGVMAPGSTAQKALGVLPEGLSSTLKGAGSLISDKVLEADVMKERIIKAMIPSLKVFFPGNTSNDEMKQFIAMNWNDKLPPAENARKIRSSLPELRARYQNMEDRGKYFESHDKSLKGYQPSSNSAAGADSAIDDEIKALKAELGLN